MNYNTLHLIVIKRKRSLKTIFILRSQINRSYSIYKYFKFCHIDKCSISNISKHFALKSDTHILDINDKVIKGEHVAVITNIKNNIIHDKDLVNKDCLDTNLIKEGCTSGIHRTHLFVSQKKINITISNKIMHKDLNKKNCLLFFDKRKETDLFDIDTGKYYNECDPSGNTDLDIINVIIDDID